MCFVGGFLMDNKKINEMTNEELLIFIKNKVNNIKESLDEYNKYYNKKNSNFEKILGVKNHIHNELIRNAYQIKDILEHVEWSYNKQTIIDSLATKSSTKPKRGEIWTCQLGKNVGSEENKIRPVIIIQNNTGNEKSPTTIIVPISNRPKKIAIHISLKESDYALVEGEIENITGTVLCEQIKVISKARLGRHIGTLKDEFVNKFLNVKLKNSIEL